ncbi:hypothetical protein [Sphaerisporangium rufum]|uniref:hypothetical protein n=1 Tax=Sphaerisporangium rufum TaxID=1381558 RepID=UPI0019515EED|nr:hypothetical protein [Sphaerisporangium rufum]
MAGWAGLLVVVAVVGAVLHARGVLRIDHLPPLHGHARVPPVGLWAAVVVGALVVGFLPRVSARWRFGVLLGAAYGCAVVWAVALAVGAGGVAGVAGPLARPEEYLAVLPAVGGDPLGWLSGFVVDLPGYPTHVRGHPPLPVLVVWVLAVVGLPGGGWAGCLVVAVGCSSVVAVGVVVRELAGEAVARRVVAVAVVTPAAVWVATSMDALFAGVAAWAVALVVLGRRRGVAGWVAVSAGGVAAGVLPFLSYGLVPFLLVVVAAGWVAGVGRWRAVVAVAGVAGVVGVFAVAGFWWPAGVAATGVEWAADPGAARPYWYFVVANVAVLGLVAGPGAVAGLAELFRRVGAAGGDGAAGPVGRWRGAGVVRVVRVVGVVREVVAGWVAGRPVAVVVAAVLVAVAALDVAGVTRGEVERIWLPYAVWVGVAAGWAPGRRWWWAQVGWALLVQGVVVSPW